MPRRYIFSSESVGEGHPDKVCDTISDAILDACLAQDKLSRVACETFVKSNIVVVGGEITTEARFDYNAIIRQAIREIGYVNKRRRLSRRSRLRQQLHHRAKPRYRPGGGCQEGEGKKDSGAGCRRSRFDVRLCM